MKRKRKKMTLLQEGIASLQTALASHDYETANLEYTRFIQFIQSLSQPIRSHAANFLYPFYVYLYIYLLAEEKITDAEKFLVSNKSLFTNAEGYSKAVQCLTELKTLQSVKDNSYFSRFCESKYVVKVSEDSLKYLLSFLEEHQSKWLSIILFTHLFVEDINSRGNQSREEISKNEVKSPESEPNPKQPEKVENNKIESSQSKAEIATDQVKSEAISQPKTTPLQKAPTSPTGKHFKKMSSYMFIVDEKQDSLCCAAFSKSNALACGFFNSTVKLWTSILDSNLQSEVDCWNSDDSEEFQTPVFEKKMIHCSNPDRILYGHDGSVFGTAFLSKWDLLMTCSEDNTVKAWDMNSYENVATYCEHKYPVFDIDISPDSSFFATASQDATARLWCFERSSSVRIFAGHSSDVDCIKFHLNGRYLATTSLDKSIILWTVQDARPVRQFTGHDAPISCIAFSQNGRQLASADDSGCIYIWDLGSGQKMTEVKAHDSRILSLNFNRKCTYLASGGFDNYLKVWDIQGCLNPRKSEMNESVEDFSHMELSASLPSESTFHHLQFSKSNLVFSVTTHCDLKQTKA